MKNTFISAMLFFTIQVGFGQDGWASKLDPQLTNGLPHGQFKGLLTQEDPLEQIKALDQFNTESKRIHNRSGIVFQLDSTVQRILHGSIGSINAKLVRHYQYGENDKTSMNILTLISPDGDTAAIYTEAFLYNELNLVSQYDLQFISAPGGALLYWERKYFTYNTDGLLESTVEYYSSGGTLEPADSTIISYNTQGLPALIINHNWDQNSAIWFGQYKQEYTYTPFKKLLSYVGSAKNDIGSPWELISKKDYTQTQNLLLTIISYSRMNNAWEKTYRSDFTYDAQGHLVQRSDKIWIPEGFQWQDEYLYIYEYNAEGKRTTARDRRWFQDGHEWIIGDSLSYEYNMLGDTSMIWSYSRNQPSNPWVWEGWGKYYYNTAIPFSDIVLRPQSYFNTLPVTFNAMLTGSLLLGLGDYDLQDSVEYYYSVVIVATANASPELVSIYPNPATDFIQLNIPGLNAGAQLRLFSSSGSLSLSTTIEPSHTVDVSQLPPGIYALQVRNGREIYTGRVAIVR